MRLPSDPTKPSDPSGACPITMELLGAWKMALPSEVNMMQGMSTKSGVSSATKPMMASPQV